MVSTVFTQILAIFFNIKKVVLPSRHFQGNSAIELFSSTTLFLQCFRLQTYFVIGSSRTSDSAVLAGKETIDSAAAAGWKQIFKTVDFAFCIFSSSGENWTNMAPSNVRVALKCYKSVFEIFLKVKMWEKSFVSKKFSWLILWMSEPHRVIVSCQIRYTILRQNTILFIFRVFFYSINFKICTSSSNFSFEMENMTVLILK